MLDVGAFGHIPLGALFLPRALIDDKTPKEEILGFEITGLKTVHKGWTEFVIASVLPYDPERRTAILVRQFRAPVCMAGKKHEVLEAIAGIVENENPDDAALREAMEEAGLELEILEPAGLHWTMPGISTERMALFLAPYRASQRTGEGGGLEHEQL
jgi:nudix-type nucleoside diphosphatase (YffH/AdpP family)